VSPQRKESKSLRGLYISGDFNNGLNLVRDQGGRRFNPSLPKAKRGDAVRKNTGDVSKVISKSEATLRNGSDAVN
jgi:hypothetical protein